MFIYLRLFCKRKIHVSLLNKYGTCIFSHVLQEILAKELKRPTSVILIFFYIILKLCKFLHLVVLNYFSKRIFCR